MEWIMSYAAGHQAMTKALGGLGSSEEDTAEQMAEAIEAALLQLAQDRDALRGAALALADRMEAASRMAGQAINELLAEVVELRARG
jgi:hypothetical protein